MKKTYTAPRIVINLYALDDPIAAGCTYYVSLGPAVDDYIDGQQWTITACSEYADAWDVSAASADGPFYTTPKTCSCYLSSGNAVLASS